MPPPHDRKRKPKNWESKWWQRWLTGILVLAIVFLLVDWLVRMAKDYTDQQNWSNSELAARFIISPGLAGFLAIVAAALSFWALHRQLQHSRLALAHDQHVEANKSWWDTFEWAADRALPKGEKDQALPFSAAYGILRNLRDTEPRGARSSEDSLAAWKTRQNACDSIAKALLDKQDNTGTESTEVETAVADYLEGRTDGPTPASAHLQARLYELQAIGFLETLFAHDDRVKVLTQFGEVRQYIRSLHTQESMSNGRKIRNHIPDAIILRNGKELHIDAYHLPTKDVVTRVSRRVQLRAKDPSPYQNSTFIVSPDTLYLIPEEVPDKALRSKWDIPDYIHFAQWRGAIDNDRVEKQLLTLLD